MDIQLYTVKGLKQQLSQMLGIEISTLYLAQEMNNVLDPKGLPIPETIVPRVFTGYYRFWGNYPGATAFEIKCPQRAYDELVKDKAIVDAGGEPRLNNLVITAFEVKTSKKNQEYNHVYFDIQEFSGAF